MINVGTCAAVSRTCIIKLENVPPNFFFPFSDDVCIVVVICNFVCIYRGVRPKLKETFGRLDFFVDNII